MCAGILNHWNERYIDVIPNECVPMNDDFTLFSSFEFAALVRKAVKQEKMRQPKMTTIKFLKDFAHNYRANLGMPDGLQGYMLS